MQAAIEMMSKSKIVASVDVRSASLLAINVACALALLSLWISGTRTAEILGAPAAKFSSDAAPFELSVSAVDLDNIQQQVLFHASRAFYVPPPPENVVVEMPSPDFRFAGSMTFPQQSPVAFLIHNQTGIRSKVKQGDQLEGWTVTAVDNRQVILSLDSRQVSIHSKTQQDLQSPAALSSSNSNWTPPAQPQAGVRVLSGGTPRAQSSSSMAAPQSPPPAPPGGIGARLYRPPPAQ
jgi:hypothetical protein